MFNNSNLILELSEGSSNILIGKSSELVFSIKNTDTSIDLYNLNLEFEIPDGLEIVSSSYEISNVSGNIYSFINIKDLASNELDFKFSIRIKVKENYSDNTQVLSGDNFLINLTASLDDMPRGDFDLNNEVVTKTLDVNILGVNYLIEEGSQKDILLGEGTYLEFSIETSINYTLTLEELKLSIANGLEFTNNIQFIGYTSNQLQNYIVTSPSLTLDNYEIFWSNITIPQNTKLTIKYEVIGNERYYLSGVSNGAFIKHDEEGLMEIFYKIDSIDYTLNYFIRFLEFVLDLIISKTNVDINDNLDYKIRLRSNSYNQLSNIILYLTTSDGQILDNTSTPTFISKETSATGITQVAFSFLNMPLGGVIEADISGVIGVSYSNTELIYSGDTFDVSAEVQLSSIPSNGILNEQISNKLNIDIPSIIKTITGAYYSDLTSKSIDTLAPGDFIGYKLTYDSLNIQAPSKRVKIFDFYPLSSRDISNISYTYSNPLYPNTGVVEINPNGVFWFVQEIEGNISFDIDYNVQIKYENSNNYFNKNLAKVQVLNSDGINFSNRDEVEFFIGKPNIKTTKVVSGNDIEKIKIGETYNVTLDITNLLEEANITDGFNIDVTEVIDSGLDLDAESVVVSNGNIVPTVTGNTINFKIDKLSVGETITLNYSLLVEDFLDPNETFNLTTTLSNPYSQEFLGGGENLLYDTSIDSNIKSLKSENITLSITTDKSYYEVGEVAEYFFDIVLPMGQKILSLYGLILIQDSTAFTGEAYLNNIAINPSVINNTVVFDTMTNVDTTGGAVSLNYRIKNEILDSTVNSNSPSQTNSNIYGNLNYLNKNGDSLNEGVSTNVLVKHPVVELSLGSSSNNFNFSQIYDSYNNLIYTEVKVVNTSVIDAKDVVVDITMPSSLEFLEENIKSLGASSTYDSNTRKLEITFDTLEKNSEKFLVFKSNFYGDFYSESVVLLVGIIKEYYNTISSTKIYSSSNTTNSTIYVKSVIDFEPLSFYSLVGSDSAINLSPKGVQTEIAYIVTNKGEGIENLILDITPLSFPYSVYVGNNFVQSVGANTSLNLTTSFLGNIPSRSSRYIRLVYTIPNDETSPYYDTTQVKITSSNNFNSFKIIPTTLQDP